jgi:hypothetical protein
MVDATQRVAIANWVKECAELGLSADCMPIVPTQADYFLASNGLGIALGVIAIGAILLASPPS